MHSVLGWLAADQQQLWASETDTEQVYIHIPVDIGAGSHSDALWLHTEIASSHSDD